MLAGRRGCVHSMAGRAPGAESDAREGHRALQGDGVIPWAVLEPHNGFTRPRTRWSKSKSDVEFP
jgi:hypothetical protein